MKTISYRQGYKYQLFTEYSVMIPAFKSEKYIVSPSGYITLSGEGLLTVSKGYAWDGASGPSVDTHSFMRGSLVHDALYQLMREELITSDGCRDKADILLRELCEEDGMGYFRAWYVYHAVRFGGGYAADPNNRGEVFISPNE